MNIKSSNTERGDYERIYLSIIALVLGAVDMSTRLVSIAAASESDAIGAAKHIAQQASARVEVMAGLLEYGSIDPTSR